MVELLIRVGGGPGTAELERFLAARSARTRRVDEHCVAVDLDAEGCPQVATLVADLDAWRSSSRVGEVALELDGERRVLRTET